jgi:diguanylate cyclase (GGDEF)-like protein
MSQHWRLRGLILLAVCSIAGAVLAISTFQRAEENRVSRQLVAAQQMLSALIEAHAALHSYAGDGDVNDAVDFGVQERNYATASRSAFVADGEQTRRSSLSRQNAVADAYFRQSRLAIDDLRTGTTNLLSARQNDLIARLLHRFENENQGYVKLIQTERRSSLNLARWLSVGLVVGLSLLFGAIGQLLLVRNQRQEGAKRRRERKYRDDQREFTEVLQVTESEADAYELIKRHIERTLPASSVTVMSRNNSHDRLEPRTAVEPGTQLAERLLDAEPRSCLAIRLAREHVRTPGEQELLTCAVCECLGPSVCVPSIVSGEVIGSVLIERADPLGDAELGRAVDTVGQAAPALGNLRNLAVSESRALTDSLTGLPNSRAVKDMVKRMVAQASRMVVPLSAVMVDLDHFKQINDTFGHEKGDEALAAVGDVLANAIRESDFVGRYGGEEFLMLLPNTDKEGALEVAEKLRHAVSLINVQGTDRMLTTSCGVATFPNDAKDREGLLRLADRALYAAKAAGRDRVSEAVLNDATPASTNGAGTT